MLFLNYFLVINFILKNNSSASFNFFFWLSIIIFQRFDYQEGNSYFNLDIIPWFPSTKQNTRLFNYPHTLNRYLFIKVIILSIKTKQLYLRIRKRKPFLRADVAISKILSSSTRTSSLLSIFIISTLNLSLTHFFLSKINK